MISKTLRALGILVLLSVLITSYWAYTRYIRPPHKNIVVFEVQLGDIDDSVSSRGVVQHTEEYMLEFPFSGLVDEVFVKLGDQVKAGDKLLKLDTKDLEFEKASLASNKTQNELNLKKLLSGAKKEDVNIVKTEHLNTQENLESIKKIGNKDVENASAMIKYAELDLLHAVSANENAEKQIANSLENIENIKSLNEAKIQTINNQISSSIKDAYLKIKIALGDIDNILDIDNKYGKEYIQDLGSVNPSLFVSAKDNYRKTAKFVGETAKKATYVQAVGSLESTIEMLEACQGMINSTIPSLSLTSSTIAEFKSIIERNLLTINSVLIGLKDQNHNLINIKEGNNIALQVARSSYDNLIAQRDATLSGVDNAKNKISQTKLNRDIAMTQLRNQVSTAVGQVSLSKNQLTQVLSGSRQEDIAINRAQIEAIDIKLKQIQDQIDRSTLTTPLSGIVTSIGYKEGEIFRFLGDKSQSAIIVASQDKKITSEVSELDIGRIESVKGGRVKLKCDAFEDNVFDGIVSSIDPKEIVKDGDRYYKVNIQIGDQQGINLRTGMNCDVTFIISSKKGIMYVPRIAIERNGKQGYVNRVDGEKLIKTEVLFGVGDAEKVEILSGLTLYDTIGIE